MAAGCRRRSPRCKRWRASWRARGHAEADTVGAGPAPQVAPRSRDRRSLVAFGASAADRSWSWQDLLDAAEHLRERELPAGVAIRTLIAGDDRFQILAAALACWASGGVVVFPPNRRP